MSCAHCGLHYFPDPTWLDEAYQKPINDSDTGILQRNIELSKKTFALLLFFRGLHKPGLDFAGGYGLFVRLMRDAGVRFYWHDRFTKNVFANGFEASPGKSDFNFVTAFEVLEHVPNPVAFLHELKDHGNSLFLSTKLVPKDLKTTWWYLGLDHGQHIQFHSKRSLEILADQLQLNLVSHGDLHLFTTKPISRLAFILILKTSPIWWSLRKFFCVSLTMTDSQQESIIS